MPRSPIDFAIRYAILALLVWAAIWLAIGVGHAQTMGTMPMPMSPAQPGQGEHDHSLYDPECCNKEDCEPLDDDQVKVTAEGFILPDGTLVPHGRERESRDGRYHWCRQYESRCTGGYCHRTGNRLPTYDPQPFHDSRDSGPQKRICFYAPKGGS